MEGRGISQVTFRSLLREVVLFVACAIFTGTVGLLLLDTVIMPYLVRKGQQVAVPDIVGTTPSQARRKLARYGLLLKLQEPRWDVSVPEGHLMVQNPSASSMVKQNRTIYAVPSLGSRLYEVPDVRGKALRQARLWIQQSGLEEGEVTEAASESVKEGLVISQQPLPGQEVEAGTPLSLVISNGPPREFVLVPDLVGLKLGAARSKLSSFELRVKEIRYEFSTAYVPNTVIQHVPGAGEEVKRGTGVRLVISKL